VPGARPSAAAFLRTTPVPITAAAIAPIRHGIARNTMTAIPATIRDHRIGAARIEPR
jgi:hypothetical protein